MLLAILPVYGKGSNQLNHALMQAAEKGNLNEVRALIGKGADVNAKVKDPAGVDKYDTALTLAYQARHMDVVLELLNKGADINAGWLPPYAEVDIEVYRANIEIGSVYNRLMSTLQPNQQNALREKERAWIKWRDKEAERIAHTTSVGGSAYTDDYLDAMLSLIQKRIEFLKNYSPGPTGSTETAATNNLSPMPRQPTGKAPNLIVLAHGCCTDGNGLKEWDGLGNKISQEIPESARKNWEIVVWDWTKYTPVPSVGINVIQDFVDEALQAYTAASGQGYILSNDIKKYTIYQYIHFIGHSAGANLIDVAAKDLTRTYGHSANAPFIYLTFLDAFTPSEFDKASYGSLPKYSESKQYAEHYVDVGVYPDTNACLSNAFNFNITNWSPDKASPPLEGGHQWPRRWYEESVTTSGFRYGFPLSHEGGNGTLSKLSTNYTARMQCELKNKDAVCKPASCWSGL